jgi:molybdopterin-guanine dinucleotide biosynthesis protein A
MGRDKALIEVSGRALACIAADALAAAGADDVCVVGGDAGALEALGLRVVPDGWPGEGPLGGLLTALENAAHDTVVVLACDLPGVTAEAVRALVAALEDHDGAVPVVAGRAQHLVAAWHRDQVLGPLRDAFVGGERAIWRACDALRVAPVTLREPSWTRDANNADALFRAAPEG